MQSYHINDLERLTGIKAHTIRIWEKRYALIMPERTTTNRRSYDNDQVRKLLNVSSLLSKGYKISKIAAFSEAEINSKILTSGITEQMDIACTNYVNRLMQHMIVYDEQGFEQTFDAASKELGMHNTMVRVIYPFLYKTGIFWSVDNAMPAQEHFASNIIRKKLITATAALSVKNKKPRKALLFLPEGEWHEIGLLFADHIIRSRGHNVYYLGQNVPYDNVYAVAEAVEPDMLMMFYVTPKPQEEIDKEIKMLAVKNAGKKVLVAGNRTLFSKKKEKNVTYMTGVNDLEELLAKYN